MEYGRLAVWLAVYLAFTYAGMPVARALLPQLADRGAALALPIALGIVWLVAYFLGHLSITAGLWLGIFVLAALAGASLYFGDRSTVDNRAFAEVAAVFTLAFLFMIAIRTVDPSAHPGGGEKFLDMGLLQSLLRGSTIPPEDAWFAGETVRYYYGGHYLSALLARVTGTGGRFAYNLALAGFYAMLVTGVYGLAGSIATSRGVSRRPAGVLGAFFVGFAANLLTPGRFLLGLLPDGLTTGVAEVLGVEVAGAAESLSAFGYWDASRVIQGTINEFPLFAWLNGDLHAHMMSPAALVVLLGVLLNLYLAETDQPRWQRLGLLFGVVPAVAGAIAVVNTWSFLTVWGLVVLTLALGRVSPATLLFGSDRDGGTLLAELRDHVLAAAAGVVVLLLGVAWSLPYWLWVLSTTNGTGFLPSRSGIGGLLIVHGAFLVLFWLHAYRHAAPTLRSSAGFVALSGVAVVWAALSGVAALGLFGPLIVMGWVLSRRAGTDATLFGSAGPEDDTESLAVLDGGVEPTVNFETVLIVAAAGLVVLVEFVYVADAAPERFNTVFKIYVQVWILASVAAGVVLASLLRERSPDLGLTSQHWRRGFAVLAVVLLAATSMYGVLALSDHFSEQHLTEETTLDALAYVEDRHPDEAPAIEWLLEVEGQPNMVSDPNNGDSPGEGYAWGNAPASMTGVPTLAGWWPEGAYRGNEVYQQRVRDVETIFTGDPAEQRHLLEQYDVELIYVGPNEREQYPRMTVTRLDAVSVAASWDAVTIYRVNGEWSARVRPSLFCGSDPPGTVDRHIH